MFIPCNGAYIKGSCRKDILFYTTDDKQKGHIGTPVKNILITLLINTISNLKENTMKKNNKSCLYHEACLHCLDWES